MLKWFWNLLGYKRVIIVDKDGDNWVLWAYRVGKHFVVQQYSHRDAVLVLGEDGTIKHGKPWNQSWIDAD